MNIHEYQAKKLFADHGITVARGFVAATAEEAAEAFNKLGLGRAVVKAQIHAGGRGKAGGVKLVSSAEECAELAGKLLGSTLVTHQTGPGGNTVPLVYVEAASSISREYYLAMLVNRESAAISLIFSTQGGVDIEELAKTSPEKITTLTIDPTVGLKPFHLRKLSFAQGLSDVGEVKQLGSLLGKLYQLFLTLDFSMLEINPLIVTDQGEIMPLDGKMIFDDNSLFRHPEIVALRDNSQEDSREVEATSYGLNYIGLEGNIGCMVNGAGLAMATMDIIKHCGGRPANFLDVGGGATEDMVRKAFRIILADENVQGIFVNIFGGIMRCEVIARGIIAVCQEMGITVPLVARLEGTNMQEGRKLLETSGLKIYPAENMAKGAELITSLVRR